MPAISPSENIVYIKAPYNASFTGRVVILDDNLNLINTIRRILSKLGFQVESLTNPNKFLTKWRQYYASHTVIACVFIDLPIPSTLNGLEIIKLIRKEDLTIKISLTTGYPPDQLTETAPSLSYNAFLQKTIYER